MEIQNQKKWTKDHEYLKKKFKTVFNTTNPIFLRGGVGGEEKQPFAQNKNTKGGKIKTRIVLIYGHWCIDAQTAVIILRRNFDNPLLF